MSETIELRREGAWLTVWLNRPAARNAMTAQMVEELVQAFADAAADQTVRGITLRGHGGVFCAGGDLKQFKSVLQGGAQRDAAVHANLRAGEMFMAVASSPKPVLALIEGAAMAGGLGLACAADIVVVTADARFALTETRLGIPPAQIAAHVVRRIGPARARRIMLTGATFGGEQAAQLGIADIVVPDAEELAARELSLRADILQCAPHATAVTKALIGAIDSLDADEIPLRAANDFAACLLGEEGREGLAAFVEKRAPGWAIRDSKP